MNNNTQHKLNTGWTTIVVLLFSLVALFCVSGYKGILNMISAGFVCIIIICILACKHLRIKKNKAVACILLFMIFYTITSFVDFHVEDFIVYFPYNLMIFSPVFVFLFLKDNATKLQMKKALIYALFILGGIGAITLVTYILNPSIARMAAAYQEQYSGMIFGGYSFAYGSALLLVYLFANLKNGTIHKYKWLTIVGIAFLFMIIFLTESSLTTFATIAGIIVTVIVDTKDGAANYSIKKFFKILILLGMIFVAYVIVEKNIDGIMAFINRKSDTLFFYRIGEVLRSVFYSDTTGHVEKRSGLIGASWKLFCQSPIIGWGYRYGNVFSLGKQFGIGNHSEFLDILAKHGLIGGIPLLGVYYFGIKEYIKKYSGLLVSLIMLMFFNPFMTFTSFFIIFYVIPMFEYQFNVNNN